MAADAVCRMARGPLIGGITMSTCDPAAVRSPHPTQLLASVRSASEAQLVLAAGAQVVDAKEPRDGALGALPLAVIADIVRAVEGRVPVSATTGDLALDDPELGPAALAVALTGVDYVKIGIFGQPDAQALQRCLQSLPSLPCAPGRRQPARYIAVLMADQGGIDWPLAAFRAAQFAGVMLDTADKRCGGLRAIARDAALRDFVDRAHQAELLVGLAGSLEATDIPALCRLQPSYLGFRTALCGAAGRTGDLDLIATRRLCTALLDAA